MAKPKIIHMVLDVLKPHQPPLPEFAVYIGEHGGCTSVDISVVEMDEKTESLKILINGTNLNYEQLKHHMEKQGAVIHSVDRVTVE